MPPFLSPQSSAAGEGLGLSWSELFWCSTGVMGEYEPKIEVRFPETTYAAKGSSVRLECFALGK